MAIKPAWTGRVYTPRTMIAFNCISSLNKYIEIFKLVCPTEAAPKSGTPQDVGPKSEFKCLISWKYLDTKIIVFGLAMNRKVHIHDAICDCNVFTSALERKHVHGQHKQYHQYQCNFNYLSHFSCFLYIYVLDLG